MFSMADIWRLLKKGEQHAGAARRIVEPGEESACRVVLFSRYWQIVLA